MQHDRSHVKHDIATIKSKYREQLGKTYRIDATIDRTDVEGIVDIEFKIEE